MAESCLTVEIVPICTEEDRQQFGMWRRNIKQMLSEIILEMRGLSKGEIDEWMGHNRFDFSRTDNPGAGDLGRPGLWIEDCDPAAGEA